MPDKDGYPTEDELKKLKEWDVIKDPMGLVSFLEEIWNWPDWCFVKRNGYTQFKKRRCIKLELHTGGWSGNEEIISILNKSWFWYMFWKKSVRGGHYSFEIPIKDFGKGD